MREKTSNFWGVTPDTVMKMVIHTLIVGIIISFMIGYIAGRSWEAILNLNEIAYSEKGE